MIGMALGAISVIGVVVNALNVNSLSEDQDSICTTVCIMTYYFSIRFFNMWYRKTTILIISLNFQVKALGDTSLTATSTSNMAALDPATAGGPTDAELAAYNSLIIARFNLIEAKLNGYATPSC